MTKIKKLAITTLTVFMSAIPASMAQTFTDVPEDFWGYDSIEYVVKQNIMGGYPDLSFLPNNPISRAEAIKVLVAYLGLEIQPTVESSFLDVPANAWYSPYIEAGKGLLPQREILDQKAGFLPDMPISREDLTYAIVVALGYSSQTEIVDQSVLNMFSDADSISSINKPFVAFAINNNLVSGFPDNTFRAQDPLSRAEFATMMAKAAKHGKNTNVDGKTSTIYINGNIIPKYNGHVGFTRFAGEGSRNLTDNANPLEASFINPTSITYDENTGVVYIADGDNLRSVTSNGVSSYTFNPQYITPKIVEYYGDALYFISNAYEDNNNNRYYSIIKHNDTATSNLFTSDAVYTDIYDISIDNGIMYILQYNAGYDLTGSGNTTLCTLNLDTKEFNIIKEFDDSFDSLDVYNNMVYLGSSANSYIARMSLDPNDGYIVSPYFGSSGNPGLIDDGLIKTVTPRKIICHDGYVYFIDYNVLRRVPIKDTNWVLSGETLAGKFTPDKSPSMNQKYFQPGYYDGSEAVFTGSAEMDFCFISPDSILLTDPKKAMVWNINLKAK